MKIVSGRGRNVHKRTNAETAKTVTACVFTAIVTAILVLMLVALPVMSGARDADPNFDQKAAIDSHMERITNLEQELLNRDNQHQAEIDTLKETHENEIAVMTNNHIVDMVNMYESLCGTVYLDNLSNTQFDLPATVVDPALPQPTSDFEYLKKYWYVFKEAPANSGITTDVIVFMENQCIKWDINPDWMWHIIEAESGYNAHIDNLYGSGARGLGQIMPIAGKDYWERVLGYGVGSYDHTMAYDPYINIEICTTMIGKWLNEGKAMYQALNKYSGGGGTTYYATVTKKAAAHGIILDENNTRYPKAASSTLAS